MKKFQKLSKQSEKLSKKPSSVQEIKMVTFSAQKDGEATALNKVAKHFRKLDYQKLFDRCTIYSYISEDGYQIFFGTGAKLLFNSTLNIINENIDEAGDIFYLKADDFDGVRTAGELAKDIVKGAVRNNREHEIYCHIDKVKEMAYDSIIRNLIRELYENIDGSGQQYQIFNGIVCASINSGSYLPYNPVDDELL